VTRRQPSDVAALLGCQGLIAIMFVWPFLGGWLLMLAVGVVHHEWPAVPPFAYWPCVALVALLSLRSVIAVVPKAIGEAMKR
jgi:hypothetical protein